MKKFLNEFKAFAMKGNVIDMAVGVIIATAFGKITSSLVSDIFMPIIGIITGGINVTGAFYALDGQKYASLEAANEAGVATLNYGAFLQNVIDYPDCAVRIPVCEIPEQVQAQGRAGCARKAAAHLPVLQDGNPRRSDSVPALHV